MSIEDKKETKIAHLHLLLMNMFIFETSIAFFLKKINSHMLVQKKE